MKKLFCSEFMQKKFEEFMQVDYQKHHDLKIECIRNGVVYPIERNQSTSYENESFGGVCYENLDFCELSCPKRFPGDCPIPVNKWFVGANPKVKESEIEYRDEEVFFAGVIKHSTGHFMIENFSIMWFFLNPGNKKYKIIQLFQGEERPNYDFVKTFYRGLDLNFDDVEVITKPTRFRKVIVAEQAMELNGKYHPVMKELFDKVKSKIKPANYKKVYLSKKITNFCNNRHLGDRIARKLLKKNGYKIVYPEITNTEDFIAILNGCEVLAAESGSNAHNAFLLNDKVKCIVFNRSPHVHPTQLMINEMRNLETFYVDTCVQSFPVQWSQGPFIFIFTRYLKEFLDRHGFRYDEKELSHQTHKLLWDYLSSWSDAALNDDVYLQNKDRMILTAEHISRLSNEFSPLKKKRYNLIQTVFSEIKRKFGL